MNSAGAVDLPFTLGSLHGQHEFVITPSLGQYPILGTDFLGKFSVVPDVKNGVVLTSAGRVPICPPAATVCLVRPVQVPELTLIVNSALPAAAQESIRKLLHPALFATPERPLGHAKRFEFSIELKDSRPVRVPLRRVSPKERQFVAEEVEMLQRIGAIRPSNSPWACAIVLVPKKDGSTRFCIDYRPLNQRTIRDAHPIPLIQDMLTSLQGARYFTSMDAASGYWQVPIHPRSRPLTAFICSEGLFEWNVLPFGLMNAPPFFQRMMNTIFAGMIGRGVLIYVDDILVYGSSLEEHNRVLSEALRRLRQEGLLLKPSKCRFAESAVEFLGHVVSDKGIQPAKSKVEVLLNFPVPGNVTELRTFIGLGSYYRRFIRGFAILAAPLHDLTGDVPWDWTDKCQEAFEAVKNTIAEAAIQTHPDFSKPFIVDTDASDLGIAVVLSQVDAEGLERPVLFDSRKLSKAEGKWPIREKEALAIIWGLQKCRPYILGSRFHVRTDHSSLEWLFKAQSGRLGRWAVALAEYLPFDIVHRAGKHHCNADAFTRVFAKSECLPDYAYITAVKSVLPDNTLWQQEQEKDPSCVRLARDNRAVIRDGLLGVGRGARWRPVLPQTLIDRTAREWHAGPGAHMGARKLLSVMSRSLIIPAGGRLVKEAIKNCLACAQRKPPVQKLGLLASSPPSKPWDTVAMDFAGPYAESASGNRYVLVFVDHFTKWVELVPTSDQLATTVIKAFYSRILCSHGSPSRLLSDNGPQFRSSLVEALCAHFGIKKVYTSAYYPQGDGYAERMMRTMNNSASALSAHSPENWDDFLPGVQFAYNCAEHEATKLSPFELCTGRTPRIPEAAVLHAQTGLSPSQAEYLRRLRNILTDAYDRARKAVQAYWSRMKTQFDRNRREVALKPGDLVLIKLTEPERSKFTVRKLAPRWSAPATIVDCLPNGVTYRVRPQCGEPRTVHVSHLLPLDGVPWGRGFPGPDPVLEPGPSLEPLRPVEVPYPTPLAAGPSPTQASEVWVSDASPKPLFKVKRIVRSRTLKGVRQMLVHWEGYDDPKDHTWEPRSALEEDVPQCVRAFDRRPTRSGRA